MKSIYRNFKTEMTFSFDPVCPKSDDIAKSLCLSLKSDTRSDSTNTVSKFAVRDSKLLIQISTTNIADLRACVNTNLRLTNMAYLSILD